MKFPIEQDPSKSEPSSNSPESQKKKEITEFLWAYADSMVWPSVNQMEGAVEGRISNEKALDNIKGLWEDALNKIASDPAALKKFVLNYNERVKPGETSEEFAERKQSPNRRKRTSA